jgi:hypothetical protein
MIDGFMKFNESVDRDIDKLKRDVDDAFAYISDDSKVSSYVRDNEVYVDIFTTLPNNIVYDNIEEYVNKHEIWHETLLDISVAIQQLTSKGDIGFTLNINTVGNVKILFNILNDKLLILNNLSITIGKNNLMKFINDDKISLITKEACERNEFKIYFSELISPDYQKEIAVKIKDIFNKNMIVDNTNEGVQIKTWPYEVGNLSIKIFKFRDNSKNAYRSVKIQNVI